MPDDHAATKRQSAQNERWTNGVYLHLCRHGLRRRGLNGLFWPNPVERQSAGCNDNCVKRTRRPWPLRRRWFALGLNPTLRFARQARALPTLAVIGLSKRRSNGPRGTDDQNPLHSLESRAYCRTWPPPRRILPQIACAQGSLAYFFPSHLQNHRYTYGHGTFD